MDGIQRKHWYVAPGYELGSTGAYASGLTISIDYIDIDYGTAKWETEEIRPPWTRTHAAHADSIPPDGKVDISAVVRKFDLRKGNRSEATLVYDGELTRGSEGATAQCVIVARSKEADDDQQRVFYVLLVESIRANTRRGEDVYKRIGAGTMMGKFISLDESGTPAKIY